MIKVNIAWNLLIQMILVTNENYHSFFPLFHFLFTIIQRHQKWRIFRNNSWRRGLLKCLPTQLNCLQFTLCLLKLIPLDQLRTHRMRFQNLPSCFTRAQKEYILFTHIFVQVIFVGFKLLNHIFHTHFLTFRHWSGLLHYR